MTNTEAYEKIRRLLVSIPDHAARDLRDILRLGAGDLGLPDGAVLDGPEEMKPDRRIAYCSLVDGIRCLGGGEKATAEFQPVRAGAWEAVLATLVVEGQWEKIRETADDLRHDVIRDAVEALIETKDVCPDGRLWQVRTSLEKLL